MVQVPEELGHGVGAGGDGLAQDRCGSGGRRQPDDIAAAGRPRGGKGTHRGRLARSGGGDRELHPCAGGGHLGDQGGLPGVERQAVRSGLGERVLDGGRGRAGAVALAGVGDDPRLGREQVGGGEERRPGDRVDARAVAATQRGGGVDVPLGAGERHRAAGQDLVDQEADEAVDVLGADVGAADLALGFGLDVPALPVGAVRLERLLDGGRGLADPRGVDGAAGRRGRV